MSHASRGKYLGKILGSRWNECVINLSLPHQCVPQVLQGKQWKHWVMCSEWSQQSCLSRWALKQLEEHANGQTRYCLECEHLLAVSDTEKLQRVAKDWHRLWSYIGSQSNICRCKKALGEKVTLGTFGGVVARRVCLCGIFSFKDLDYLKLGY